MKTLLMITSGEKSTYILLAIAAILWIFVRARRMLRTTPGGVEEFSNVFSWLFISAFEILLVVIYRFSFLVGGLMLILQWLNRVLINIR